MEMAAQLSGIELVKLGYELCGVYSLPMSPVSYTHLDVYKRQVLLENKAVTFSDHWRELLDIRQLTSLFLGTNQREYASEVL